MNTIELFLILSGIAFWSSIILCVVMLIVGMRTAEEAPDERIYQDELKKRDYEADAVDSEIDTKFLNDLDEIKS